MMSLPEIYTINNYLDSHHSSVVEEAVKAVVAQSDQPHSRSLLVGCIKAIMFLFLMSFLALLGIKGIDYFQQFGDRINKSKFSPMEFEMEEEESEE